VLFPASCLIRKVKELRDWYDDAKEKYAEMPAEEGTNDSSEVGNYEETLVKNKSKNRKEV